MTVIDGGDLVQTTFEDPGDNQSQDGAHLDYCGRRKFQVVDSGNEELWWITIDFEQCLIGGRRRQRQLSSCSHLGKAQYTLWMGPESTETEL